MAAESGIALVRHGETAWSSAGRHTGRTDIPLTDAGRAQARAAAGLAGSLEPVRVRTSPLGRARETCDLLGLGLEPLVDPDLAEWDYGDYEGITTAEIRETVPGWTVWSAPCPGGETADQVAARADRVVAACRAEPGLTLLVAHGHILRVLAARWLGLGPEGGRLFRLDTATVSVLGWERENPVVLSWNLRAGP